MKTRLFLVVLLVIIFFGCERKQSVPVEKRSFAKVIRSPSDYQEPIEHQVFTNGIVIFKKTKDDTGVLVVTDSSFLKLHRELKDDEVMAVKVKPTTVQKINIGDVIDVSGWTTLTGTKENKFYYVIASTVIVTGKTNVEDPNFEKIVAAVATKSDQGWDLINFVIVYTLFNKMLDNGF